MSNTLYKLKYGIKPWQHQTGNCRYKKRSYFSNPIIQRTKPKPTKPIPKPSAPPLNDYDSDECKEDYTNEGEGEGQTKSKKSTTLQKVFPFLK